MKQRSKKYIGGKRIRRRRVKTNQRSKSRISRTSKTCLYKYKCTKRRGKKQRCVYTYICPPPKSKC